MTDDYVFEKHDLGIVSATQAKTIGLMLAQDKNGVRQWETVDDDPLAEQRTSGVPGYGWFRPGKELPVIGDSWRSGFGLEVADSLQPERYFDSQNIDLRFRGMAICGPKATAATLPTLFALTDGGLEAWTTSTNLTSWTEEISANATVTQETTVIHGGSNSARLLTSAASTYARIYQDAANWSNDFRGCTVTVTAYMWADTGTTGRLGIDDKDAGTPAYSSYVAGDSIWHKVSVTKKLDSAATRIRVYARNDLGADAQNYYVYVDDITVNILGAHGKCWAEYNGDLFFSSNDCLLRVDATAGTITFQAGFPEPITSLEPFTDGYLYIGQGALDFYYYMNGSGTCTITDSKTDLFSAVGAVMWKAPLKAITDSAKDTAEELDAVETGITMDGDPSSAIVKGDYILIDDEVMYVSASIVTGSLVTVTRGQLNTTACYHTTNADVYIYTDVCTIYSATAPTTDAGWGGTTVVGSTAYKILAMDTDGATLYIKKEDRTFYGGVVLIDETKHLSADTEGSALAVWKGNVYVGCGAGSLVEYDAGTITWRDPATYCTNLASFDGRIQGIAGDERYLHIGVYNSANLVEILAGAPEVINGTTEWPWHPIAQLAITGIERMFVSSVYKKRLYVASTNSANSLYYFPLYANYGDVTNDANASYDTTATKHWITPWHHGEFKGDSKAWIKLTLTMEDTSSTVYWRAYYQKLGDGATWTEIKPSVYFKTSPTTSGFIPAASSVNPVSIMIRFKFVAVTGAAASTPKLLKYDCRAILYASGRTDKRINCVVRGADNLVDKDGHQYMVGSFVKTILDEANAATWPVTMYSPWGETKTVRVLSMREIEGEQGKDRKVERLFILTLQEATLS